MNVLRFLDCDLSIHILDCVHAPSVPRTRAPKSFSPDWSDKGLKNNLIWEIENGLCSDRMSSSQHMQSTSTYNAEPKPTKASYRDMSCHSLPKPSKVNGSSLHTMYTVRTVKASAQSSSRCPLLWDGKLQNPILQAPLLSPTAGLALVTDAKHAQ